MMLMAALTVAWGCSSSSDDDNNNNTEQWNGSTYQSSAKPAWAVDWTSTAAKPDWQDPDPTRFDGSSMHLVVDLDAELVSNTTSEDMMAAFIGEECRAVSRPNVLGNGRVTFLLHILGSGVEGSEKSPVELRYYCDKLHHMNTVPSISQFIPNMIFPRFLNVGDGSSKYPVKTQLTVTMPQKTPFTVNVNDQLTVFVGNECRGVGAKNTDNSWSMPVYGLQKGETAQLRYYSAEKGGVYTILRTIELKGEQQQENISF